MDEIAWTDCRMPWSRFREAGFARAGTLIYVRSRSKPYLIGEINELGGVCDDCTAFDDGEVVTQYATVWTPE